MRIPLVALAAFWLASPAMAQTPTDDWIFGAGGEDIVLEVGGGPLVKPAYDGADEYIVRPWPSVTLDYLRLPGIGTFGGSSQKDGFKFKPSFRFVRERDASEYSDLAGLDDVDWAIEAGGTVGYRYGMLEGFATVRQGFHGHHGIVAEIGLDAHLDPSPDFELSIGPRVHLASDDYFDTYFSVSPAEAAASGYPVFDAQGWLHGAGVEAKGRYQLSRHWAVRGEAEYERLLGDAADSPITKAGSANQFRAALGLTYRFGLDLFD